MVDRSMTSPAADVDSMFKSNPALKCTSIDKKLAPRTTPTGNRRGLSVNVVDGTTAKLLFDPSVTRPVNWMKLPGRIRIFGSFGAATPVAPFARVRGPSSEWMASPPSVPVRMFGRLPQDCCTFMGRKAFRTTTLSHAPVP